VVLLKDEGFDTDGIGVADADIDKESDRKSQKFRGQTREQTPKGFSPNVLYTQMIG